MGLFCFFSAPVTPGAACTDTAASCSSSAGVLSVQMQVACLSSLTSAFFSPQNSPRYCTVLGYTVLYCTESPHPVLGLCLSFFPRAAMSPFLSNRISPFHSTSQLYLASSLCKEQANGDRPRKSSAQWEWEASQVTRDEKLNKRVWWNARG